MELNNVYNIFESSMFMCTRNLDLKVFLNAIWMKAMFCSVRISFWIPTQKKKHLCTTTTLSTDLLEIPLGAG